MKRWGGGRAGLTAAVRLAITRDDAPAPTLGGAGVGASGRAPLGQPRPPVLIPIEEVTGLLLLTD